jgi:translation initiation factor 1
MSKKKLSSSPFVYSTNPDFTKDEEDQTLETKLPAEQRLWVSMESKHRAGKTVTLIRGFEGKEEDLEQLGKQLKSFCGSGGSVKDGEIIIQGDHRDKVKSWLLKNKYGVK